MVTYIVPLSIGMSAVSVSFRGGDPIRASPGLPSAERPKPLISQDTSRLSRSTESVLSIYRKLNFAGLQLISVSQGIDSRQDQAETLLTIHGLIDSSYVRELAKKTHRGCESAVLRGLHVGGSCFGYSTAPVGEPGTGSKRLVIDETQAKVVRGIFEMSATGYSLKTIARKLNEEQAAGRGNWCPTGIRAMLKRELYKGELIWNRLKFEKVPEGQLHELRQFVEKGISDLRSQLNRDTVLAKAELQKHLSEVRMTPTKDGEDWHYVAEGNWDLLGTGPNAPVLGLAHSDGCGGQI